MANEDNRLTWLNVTGTPRSGTSALGGSLNANKEISLLFEQPPDRFFSSLDQLFDYENSLKSHQHDAFISEKDKASLHIFRKDRDYQTLVTHLFRQVFGVQTPIIGTKTPQTRDNRAAMLAANYPNFLKRKEISIIRRPGAVVRSYLSKRDGTLAENPEHAYRDWVSGFNHIALNSNKSEFFWLIYEKLCTEDTSTIEEAVGRFLEIDSGLSFANFQTRQNADVAAEVAQIESTLFEKFGRLFNEGGWLDFAEIHLSNAHPIGLALEKDGVIDFSQGGNSWKYVHCGMFPPEREGAWTDGHEVILTFATKKPVSGITLNVHLSQTVAAVDDDYVSFSVLVNEKEVASFETSKESSKGQPAEMTFSTNEIFPSSQHFCVKLKITNPKVPFELGLNNDTRLLGLLVKKLTVSTKKRPTFFSQI